MMRLGIYFAFFIGMAALCGWIDGALAAYLFLIAALIAVLPSLRRWAHNSKEK